MPTPSSPSTTLKLDHTMAAVLSRAFQADPLDQGAARSASLLQLQPGQINANPSYRVAPPDLRALRTAVGRVLDDASTHFPCSAITRLEGDSAIDPVGREPITFMHPMDKISFNQTEE